MVTPIKETPILAGEDAKKFLDNMRNNEHRTISIEEFDEMKENFKKWNLRSGTTDG